MEAEVATEAITWVLDCVFGLLLAIVGFFVKQLVQDQRDRAHQLSKLTQRIVVLEERERGLAQQLDELKATVDSMAGDMRFVRERIVVLTDKRSHSER